MSAEYLASPFRHLLKDPATTSRTFRYLLRDLLRETTYLPDPWLRTYWRSYVISRYRDYLNEPDKDINWREYVKQSRLQPGETPDEPEDRRWIRPSGKKPNRQLFLLNKARKELRRLARANCGHEIALFSIMCRAYGRAGPRRHALLRDVWQNDIPEDSDQLKAIINARFGGLSVDSSTALKGNKDKANGSTKEAKKGEKEVALNGQDARQDTLGTRKPADMFRRIEGNSKLPPRPDIPKLPPRIVTLINAQISAPVSRKLSKVSVKPNIPEVNAWGRPFPAVRAKNIIADWLLHLQNTLLPPLPDKEFARLRAMARGDLDGLVTPRLPRNMPPLVKVREYDHVFRQPERRRTGTIRPTTQMEWPNTVAEDDERATYEDVSEDINEVRSDYDDSTYEEEEEEEEDYTNRIPLNAETITRNLIDLRGAHFLKANYLERLYARLLDLTCKVVEVGGQARYDWGREKPEWRTTWEAAQQNKSIRAPARGASKYSGKPGLREDAVEAGKPTKRRAAPDAWMFGPDDDDSEIVTYGTGLPARAQS